MRGGAGNKLDDTTLGSSLSALAARGVVRRYRKGTVLIEEGDVSDTLYIILSGGVRIYSSGERGREVTHGTYGLESTSAK